MSRRRVPDWLRRGVRYRFAIELTVYPASVTPFDDKDRVDPAAVAKLLAWFRSAGCTGVVLCGTNGEGPSLSAPEKRDLALLAVDLAMGLRVILGIAADSLDEAVWLARGAARAKAEAVLVMPPSFFVEASQDGIAKWYERLCEEGESPVIVYNFPKRTGIRFEVQTIQRLAENPRILGFKDSSGESANMPAFRAAAPSKRLLVGDETLLQAALESGWNGAISGAANVLAAWIVKIVQEWESNRPSAEAKFQMILPIIQSLRKLSQPGANKAILKRLGVLPNDTVRLPLLNPDSSSIDSALVCVRELT